MRARACSWRCSGTREGFADRFPFDETLTRSATGPAPSLGDLLCDLPTGPDAHDAADAAQDKRPAHPEVEEVAQGPEGIPADRRTDKNTQLDHAPMLPLWCFERDSRMAA